MVLVLKSSDDYQELSVSSHHPSIQRFRLIVIDSSVLQL